MRTFSYPLILFLALFFTFDACKKKDVEEQPTPVNPSPTPTPTPTPADARLIFKFKFIVLSCLNETYIRFKEINIHFYSIIVPSFCHF